LGDIPTQTEAQKVYLGLADELEEPCDVRCGLSDRGSDLACAQPNTEGVDGDDGATGGKVVDEEGIPLVHNASKMGDENKRYTKAGAETPISKLCSAWRADILCFGGLLGRHG
jgi:hypothetical protein